MARASGEVLSELFGGVEGDPVQVELWGVRVLFELLGFLLRRNCRDPSCFGEWPLLKGLLREVNWASLRRCPDTNLTNPNLDALNRKVDPRTLIRISILYPAQGHPDFVVDVASSLIPDRVSGLRLQ